MICPVRKDLSATAAESVGYRIDSQSFETFSLRMGQTFGSFLLIFLHRIPDLGELDRNCETSLEWRRRCRHHGASTGAGERRGRRDGAEHGQAGHLPRRLKVGCGCDATIPTAALDERARHDAGGGGARERCQRFQSHLHFKLHNDLDTLFRLLCPVLLQSELYLGKI